MKPQIERTYSSIWRVPPRVNRLAPDDERDLIKGDARTVLAMLMRTRRVVPRNPAAANEAYRTVLRGIMERLAGQDEVARDIAAHIAFLRTYGTLPDPGSNTKQFVLTDEDLNAAAARADILLPAAASIARDFQDLVLPHLMHLGSVGQRDGLLEALRLEESPARLAATEWAEIGRALCALLRDNRTEAWPFSRVIPEAWKTLVRRNRAHLGPQGIHHYRTWKAPEQHTSPVPSHGGEDVHAVSDGRTHTTTPPSLTRLDAPLNSREPLHAPETIRAWAETVRAGRGYRQTFMRTRTGKLRRLDVPDAALADVQRRLADAISSSTLFSAEVMGFVRRRSVITHARRHAGAQVAVVVDIADFFGSVRPSHVREALSDARSATIKARVALDADAFNDAIALCFCWPSGSEPYLPQGAPSSPVLANLAARKMDAFIVAAARATFGAGKFTYSRYADDLVLSSQHASPTFNHEARAILERAIRWMGWGTSPDKTRTWHAGNAPLQLCGIVLPTEASGQLTLPRSTLREARALVHRVRAGELSLDFAPHGPRAADMSERAQTPQTQATANRARGTLAWVYAVTGDPALLAFSSKHVRALGHFLGATDGWVDAFCAGWLDAAKAPL